MIDYILFCIGIIVIVISFILLKKNNDTQPNIESQMIKNRDHELLENVYLIENIIEELKKVSENTIENIDMKTNDIYHMIKTLDENMEKYTLMMRKEAYNENTKENNSIALEEHIDLIEEEHEIKHDEDTSKILRFMEDGYSPAQIAKKLNKGIGEVELICNLKRR